MSIARVRDLIRPIRLMRLRSIEIVSGYMAKEKSILPDDLNKLMILM
jgi:hypothetical protein